MPEVRLTRRVRFSAAHRYWRPEWSAERNRETFGACANPHGHGHNYVLDVTVAGTPDPETGFSVDLAALDRLLKEEVTEPLDHRHLNHDVPEFEEGGLIPTTENLVLWIWERVAPKVPSGARLVTLRLKEEEGLWVEFSGGPVEGGRGVARH
jgi:6-pyruvoyltetrahydropterin/6-carboxytetrahydropterin synthase